MLALSMESPYNYIKINVGIVLGLRIMLWLVSLSKTVILALFIKGWPNISTFRYPQDKQTSERV